MTRAAIRWMRVVLPRSEVISAAVVFEMLIEAFYLFLVWRQWPVDETYFRNLRLTWLSACAGSFGIGRVVGFHPGFNEEYERWLESTPWTADKPLPGGPVRLVPQDVIVVTALTLLAREPSTLSLFVPLAFLSAYLLTLAVASRCCGDWLFAYLIGFGLGAIALAGTSVLAAFLVAVSFCPIGLIAIQRSLRRFPWKIDWQLIHRTVQKGTNAEELARHRLGWPYDFLAPKPPVLMMHYSDGFCLSVLLGWYAFVAHYHLDHQLRMFVSALSIQLMFIATIIRLTIYVRGHRSPISFWGRIWTLRWIIPRYDVVLLGPLAAIIVHVATQAAALAIFVSNGMRGNVANPQLEWVAMAISSCGFSAALMILFTTGPVVTRWRLEGSHRIVFDNTNKQSSAPFTEL